MLWSVDTMPENAPNTHGLLIADERSAGNDKIGGSGVIESKIPSIRMRLLELKAEQASLEATLGNLQRELSALERTRPKPDFS